MYTAGWKLPFLAWILDSPDAEKRREQDPSWRRKSNAQAPSASPGSQSLTMVFCIHCGSHVPDNANFCACCGAKKTLGTPILATPITTKKVSLFLLRMRSWRFWNPAHLIATAVKHFLNPSPRSDDSRESSQLRRDRRWHPLSQRKVHRIYPQDSKLLPIVLPHRP